MNNSLVLNYEVIRNDACCLVEKYASVVSPNVDQKRFDAKTSCQ